MISREVDYAIRIVLGVAAGKGTLVSAAEIAEKMHIPYRFLRKISLALVKAGILQSRRGSGGGLIMAKDPAHLTLLEVIQVISAKGTGINLCLREEDVCPLTPVCRLHPRLEEIQAMLDAKFASIKICELL